MDDSSRDTKNFTYSLLSALVSYQQSPNSQIALDHEEDVSFTHYILAHKKSWTTSQSQHKLVGLACSSYKYAWEAEKVTCLTWENLLPLSKNLDGNVDGNGLIVKMAFELIGIRIEQTQPTKINNKRIAKLELSVYIDFHDEAQRLLDALLRLANCVEGFYG